MGQGVEKFWGLIRVKCQVMGPSAFDVFGPCMDLKLGPALISNWALHGCQPGPCLDLNLASASFSIWAQVGFPRSPKLKMDPKWVVARAPTPMWLAFGLHGTQMVPRPRPGSGPRKRPHLISAPSGTGPRDRRDRFAGESTYYSFSAAIGAFRQISHFAFGT